VVDLCPQDYSLGQVWTRFHEVAEDGFRSGDDSPRRRGLFERERKDRV
jgi:hypothetical protein